MKLKQWLYGATALAMLAACSDKDVAPGGNLDNGFSYAEGESYLGISLELPAEPSTRATNEDGSYKYDDGNQGNDRFDDGIGEEYSIKNAALILFVGTSENDAEFIGAYTLNPDEAFDQPNKDNITVSLQKTAKLPTKPKIPDALNLYGLAIVNYDKNHFKLGANNSGSLTIRRLTSIGATDETEVPLVQKVPEETDADGNVTKPAVSGTLFSAIQTYFTDCTFLNQGDASTALKCIFMTNAPLSDKNGTIVATGMQIPTIHTLAKLEKNFQQTQSDAIKNPAGCIFVERAVAKITCTLFPAKVELKHTVVTNASTGAADYTEEDAIIPIEEVSWMVDNEESESYIIRNVKDITTQIWQTATPNYAGQTRYRFIGNASMNDHAYDDITAGDGHGFYRTYWCIDPTYSSKKKFNKQATTTSTYTALSKTGTGTSATYSSGSAFYPHENTFDVAHQTYENTTRVVFKVKYGAPTKPNGDPLTRPEGTTLSNSVYGIRGYNKSFYLEYDAENLLKRNILASSQLHTLIADLVKNDKINSDGTFSLNYTENDFLISFGRAAETDAAAQPKTGTGGETLQSDYETAQIELGDYIVTSIDFTDAFKANLDMTKMTAKDVTDTLAEIALNASSDTHVVPYTVGSGNNATTTAYYAVYIQHFGDTYCPLPVKVDADGNKVLDDNNKPIDAWEGKDTDKVYDHNSAAKYLGRYGMVRNNWYDLAVSKILHLGSASVPEGELDWSDDNKEEEWYLSARIHVLSWARRTQQTEL